MTSLIGLVVPTINFILLVGVGLDLTPDDFARVRRQPALVLAGLFAPVIVLPLLALWLMYLFDAAPDVAGGILLIAACPIGGISNAYSFLARASTALSVTLTSLSCLCASGTIPLVSRMFELALGRSLDFVAPIPLLVTQLTLMLGLPIAIGMVLRRRSPQLPQRYGRALQLTAVVGISTVLLLIIVHDVKAFVGGLATTIPVAAAFVLLSLAAGWLTGASVTSDPKDRFTLAAEFGTRNITVALAIAVTLLGRVEFARFATTYALTEVPILLAAVALFRWYAARLEAAA